MVIIGYILLAIGVIMIILNLTLFIEVVPRLAELNIPLVVWIGVAIIGAVLAMMYRRARD